MYARKRWRRGPARTGRMIINGVPQTPISFDSSSEYMEDIVGNSSGDNNMYSSQVSQSSGVINHSRENRNFVTGKFLHFTSWINYPYDNRDAIDNAPLPTTWAGLPSDVSSATIAASRSNPGSPGVDLPLLLFELKDLPDMIRQTGIQFLGRRKPSHVRNNLNNDFGWAPLIGDLSKLLKFQEMVDNRISILRDLHEGKTHTRTVTVFSDSYTVKQDKRLYSGFLEALHGTVTTRVSVKKWASIKWVPTVQPPGLQRNIHREAVQLVLGLRLRPRALWDAMPWSWLVDWYSNVGDFLQATDNTYATFASACVMERYSADTTIIPTHGSLVKGATQGTIRRTTKSRKANIPISLTAESPLLGAKQLSILFQLANNYKK